MYGTFWRSLKALTPSVLLMGATVAVIVVGTLVPATAAVRVQNGLTATQRQSLTSAKAFTTKPVRFLLLGDSLAATLEIGLTMHSQARYGVHIINETVLGCDLDDLHGIVDGNVTSPVSACNAWRTLWRKQVAQYRPDVVGLLVGRWDITDHLDNGKVVYIGQPAWNQHLQSEMNQAVAVLSAHGAKVALFTMPYIDPPQLAPDGKIYPENNPERVREFNTILEQVAKAHTNVVTIINLNKLLDPEGKYQAVIDGITVRWDDGIHISLPGGEWLQPAVLPEIGQLGLSSPQRSASP